MSRALRAGDLARRFPVTLGIAALTLSFFVVEHWLGGATDPVVHLRLGALRAERVSEHGEYWRLLMPMLLHYGWVHLALNGLAFLQLGALVESLWGGKRLLLYYVVCGLGASLASATLNTLPIASSVGASGAIMGLAGVILGTTWYGREPVRGWLLDLVGRRLLHGVLLTFGLGIGLWLILPIVDNWAHAGGFATGLLIAAATPDPTEEDERKSLAASSAAAVAMIGAIVWMALAGARDEREVALDIARTISIRVSEAPGTWATSQLLAEMLTYYDRAGAPAEGLETYAHAVDDLDEPLLVSLVISNLHRQQAGGDDRDVAIALASQRWLELRPDDPEALNAMAWHLATRPTEDLRDLARAEALSRRSLERVADPDSADGRRQRAMYLDTLGEILYQRGEYPEALEVQRESVELARNLDDRGCVGWIEPEFPVDELEERLAKIENAS